MSNVTGTGRQMASYISKQHWIRLDWIKLNVVEVIASCPNPNWIGQIKSRKLCLWLWRRRHHGARVPYIWWFQLQLRQSLSPSLAPTCAVCLQIPEDVVFLYSIPKIYFEFFKIIFFFLLQIIYILQFYLKKSKTTYFETQSNNNGKIEIIVYMYILCEQLFRFIQL